MFIKVFNNLKLDGKLSENGVCYLFNKNKHVFLMNNDCEEGKEHNKIIFNLLMNWIKNDYPVGRKFHLIENIEKKITFVLKQYMNNIEQVKFNKEKNILEIKKTIEKDNLKMNEIAIDVLTGIKISSHTDSFLPTVKLFFNPFFY
jgi:hypothetical protein